MTQQNVIQLQKKWVTHWDVNRCVERCLNATISNFTKIIFEGKEGLIPDSKLLDELQLGQYRIDEYLRYQRFTNFTNFKGNNFV